VTPLLIPFLAAPGLSQLGTLQGIRLQAHWPTLQPGQQQIAAILINCPVCALKLF